MPKTSLEKTRKAIVKKKGQIDAIHEFSRDSKRLHRAAARDDKLVKVASARRKADRPYLNRAAFFQEAVKQNDLKPLELSAIGELVKEYVHQYDEELSDLKKARRPGRPASTREDLLKVKISSLQKEYENGFLLPEMTTEESVMLLDRFEGSWSYLTNLKWVKLSEDGRVQPSSFPPKGDH
ncbi:hypothetical protein PG996_001448 [Apiospora saccharicola]|uniref:Translation machinery-associated protein 16 n=1 Tax=Apiospora saccharicola TaxID=335842 RepID=A0ABR1WGN9_9PEZI